jgi:hypothetical protein
MDNSIVARELRTCGFSPAFPLLALALLSFTEGFAPFAPCDLKFGEEMEACSTRLGISRSPGARAFTEKTAAALLPVFTPRLAVSSPGRQNGARVQMSAGGGADDPEACRLFVHGLPPSVDDSRLHDAFEPFQGLVQCNIAKPGLGSVTFSSALATEVHAQTQVATTSLLPALLISLTSVVGSLMHGGCGAACARAHGRY